MRNIQSNGKKNMKASETIKQAPTKANTKAGGRSERCTRYEERRAMEKQLLSRHRRKRLMDRNKFSIAEIIRIPDDVPCDSGLVSVPLRDLVGEG